MKVSEGQSQPEIVAAAFLILYMALGSPFLYQVLIVTHLLLDRTLCFLRTALIGAWNQFSQSDHSLSLVLEVLQQGWLSLWTQGVSLRLKTKGNLQVPLQKVPVRLDGS